jgi:hypothetical protein
LLFLPANIYAGSKQHTLQIYSENLSLHRTRFNAPANTSNNNHSVQKLKHKKSYSFAFEHDITSQLHELLMDLKSFYEMTESIPGYTIQAYTGANRQFAFQVKDKLCSLYTHLHIEVQYKQPNFSVRVGRFLDRLESYQVYVGIKRDFPQAIIRPTEFPNNVSTFSSIERECLPDNVQDLEEEAPHERGNIENLSSHTILSLENDKK